MADYLLWLPLAASMLATGLAAGLMAGLLGVGGGIVMVPALDAVLGVLGVDGSVRLHVAVATSLACIVPTSLASARAHHRRGAVDVRLAGRWGPFILVGSLTGSWLATGVSAEGLAALFTALAVLVAVKMILPLDRWQLATAPPPGIAGAWPGAFIGLLSSMLGIGGGTLSVPTLSLLGVPVHRAVGTSALFGLVIAVPGALVYVVTGWGDPRMPAGNLGYVSVLGLLFLVPATVVAAPLGARIAHSLSQRTLSMVFGMFLLLVALRMLGRATGHW